MEKFKIKECIPVYNDKQELIFFNIILSYYQQKGCVFLHEEVEFCLLINEDRNSKKSTYVLNTGENEEVEIGCKYTLDLGNHEHLLYYIISVDKKNLCFFKKMKKQGAILEFISRKNFEFILN